MNSYKSGIEHIKEYAYLVFIRVSEKLPNLSTLPWSTYLNIRKSFTKVGSCDEKPFIKVVPTTKMISGKSRVISEKVEFSCIVLEVSDTNLKVLRELSRVSVDIILEDFDSKRVTVFSDTRISCSLELTGDDLDKIKLSGSQTAVDADSIMLFSVWDKRLPLYFAGSNVRIVSKSNSKINNGLFYSGTDTKIKPPANENIMNGLYYAG